MRRFIYLDTETLDSYIAQMNNGLNQFYETEKQIENKEVKEKGVNPSIKGGVNMTLFGKGLEGNTGIDLQLLRSNTTDELVKSVEKKQLHDNAFDYLMDHLDSNNLLGNTEIGSFILIEDMFYIMDIEYYKKIFDNKEIMEYVKKGIEDEKIVSINEAERKELEESTLNDKRRKEIKDNYRKQRHDVKSIAQGEYNNIKKMIDILTSIIPYKKTMCIGNNLVILNDAFMRDESDMTAFKYGGKIKVLGFITNIIGDPTLSSGLPSFAQMGVTMNEVMLSFFDDESILNIIHPIAIYYE